MIDAPMTRDQLLRELDAVLAHGFGGDAAIFNSVKGTSSLGPAETISASSNGLTLSRLANAPTGGYAPRLRARSSAG